jgi:NAD(P)-dependent dehydrogenase (short-subunit alcohol dehydrogenase family)
MLGNMDSGRFEGKSVIVTGAGQGIGRATALRFAGEGAEVMLVGRGQAALEQTLTLVQGGGGLAWTYTADVRDAAQVRGMTEAARGRWPRIDVLVNNAGVDDATPFLEITGENWDRVVDTNLKGPFLVSQAVAREMARTGGGVILHTASIDAQGADGSYAAYNASKAGLLGLNRTMAMELAPLGIRCNCVSPGFTHTVMTEKAAGPSLMRYLATSFDRVPMRRLVKPEEVAAAFAYLASDDASAVTGANLVVDCGLTANLYILETLAGKGSEQEASP